MTDPEIKLRCLELAMAQAKIEAKQADRKAVAEIATEFYALVNGTKPEVSEPQPKSRKKSDKSDLFD